MIVIDCRHGLADSLTEILFFSRAGKTPERQNAGKILGKRALPTNLGLDGKPLGKTGSTAIAENLQQQINHEGTVLADLTDEKATEKVQINLFSLIKSNVATALTRYVESGFVCVCWLSDFLCMSWGSPHSSIYVLCVVCCLVVEVIIKNLLLIQIVVLLFKCTGGDDNCFGLVS